MTFPSVCLTFCLVWVLRRDASLLSRRDSRWQTCPRWTLILAPSLKRVLRHSLLHAALPHADLEAFCPWPCWDSCLLLGTWMCCAKTNPPWRGWLRRADLRRRVWGLCRYRSRELQRIRERKRWRTVRAEASGGQLPPTACLAWSWKLNPTQGQICLRSFCFRRGDNLSFSSAEYSWPKVSPARGKLMWFLGSSPT